MKTLDLIVMTLLVIGGIAWGLVGLFGYDFISGIFGYQSIVADIIYTLIGLCAVYEIFGARAIRRRWHADSIQTAM